MTARQIKVLQVRKRTEFTRASCRVCDAAVVTGPRARAWAHWHCRETGHSVSLVENLVVECPPPKENAE